MTTDMDDAYANSAHIPGAARYPGEWAAKAAAFRDLLGARVRRDLPYGAHPRERFDLFLPRGPAQGLLIFVHGGYWLRFGREDWSHLAAGSVARGWAVAMPSYRLCPDVPIAAITAAVAQAVAAAAAMVPGPVVLSGHSAGGHLVARMACADVALPDAVSARILRVVPISPLSDLRPLLRTTMNAELRLDMAQAVSESPALGVMRAGTDVHVWVGARERPAFLDQARGLSAAWNMPVTVARGRHHFDVVEGLETPGSALLRMTLAGA